MQRRVWLSLSLALLPSLSVLRADSIWDRRDPYFANMFMDTHARRAGDLLTVIVQESTEFEGLEKREMNKETKTGALYKFSGRTGSDGASRSFAADFDGSGTSQRKFDGKNNSSIDRKFLDRMTVTVVAVMPNGDLVIEGFRQRILNREVRMLRVTGVVRPNDIGPLNTVHSQYIANFVVSYTGRGPESNFTNQGWGGRIMNALWPY